MEFADHDGLVFPFDGLEGTDFALIEVVANDVAVFLSGGARQIVRPREAAAKIELFRRDFANRRDDLGEVFLADYRVERVGMKRSANNAKR